MNFIKYEDLVVDKYSDGAIINDEYTGFKEDYLVLHTLIKLYKPKTFFEIGTNTGTGTNIICNAGKDWGMKVMSLDLPQDKAHQSLQYPHPLGHNNTAIGHRCKFHYQQLLGDSLTFDYSKHYPIDGWFIDGEHDYIHAYNESLQAMNSKAKLIIWHDSDMEQVMLGIQEAFNSNSNYILYRVLNTRMCYAIRSNNN